jgi:hypothetical protein
VSKVSGKETETETGAEFYKTPDKVSTGFCTTSQSIDDVESAGKTDQAVGVNKAYGKECRLVEKERLVVSTRKSAQNTRKNRAKETKTETSIPIKR